MAYPTIANWWNTLHQTGSIVQYDDSISKLTRAEKRRIFSNARKYNRKLARTGFHWQMTEEEKRDYESQLKIDDSGMMGYVTIPKIRVKDPVFHGTNEGTLANSIGHLEPTSLPIGGKTTHSSLTGHRGLPSARLFTDLDKLEEGDTFTITVIDHTVTYQVDQIHIILPDNIDDLQLFTGKDYCTLITCTPYGINTHRLLVRGHRIPNLNGDADVAADALQIRPIYIAPFLAIPFVVALLVIYFWRGRRRRGMAQDPLSAYMAEHGLTRPLLDREEEDLLSLALRLVR